MCLVSSNPFLDGTALPIALEHARIHSHGGRYMREVIEKRLTKLVLQRYVVRRLGLCKDLDCMIQRLITAKAFLELLYNQNAQYACFSGSFNGSLESVTTYHIREMTLSEAEKQLLNCLLKQTGLSADNFAPFYVSRI